MMDDCIKYQKGYKACQTFGNIQLALAGVMNSIVKPWMFRGWGLDFIGEIHPESSRGIGLSWLLLVISPSGPRQYR
jgi:hypothetical protein